MLEEIVRPVVEDRRPVGERCPHCRQPTRWQRIACPDRSSQHALGCFVVHYAWHCDGCDRDFFQPSKIANGMADVLNSLKDDVRTQDFD